MTPSRQVFRLRIDDSLVFKKGKFNLLIGPTGSGKTSVLMALLSEMHYIPLGPDSWVNLPREGGVAYAAQESWVQNETIKDNILFGAPFHEERYKKGMFCSLPVLHAGVSIRPRHSHLSVWTYARSELAERRRRNRSW